MPTGHSQPRCISLCLLALGAVAFTAGCVVRVGNAADAAPPMPGDATYDAARADWAKKQQQFDATFAEEITAFRAIEADLKRDDATPAIAARAEDLRVRFLKRCIDESHWSTAACWHGTFVREITLALAN